MFPNGSLYAIIIKSLITKRKKTNEPFKCCHLKLPLLIRKGIYYQYVIFLNKNFMYDLGTKTLNMRNFIKNCLPSTQ